MGRLSRAASAAYSLAQRTPERAEARRVRYRVDKFYRSRRNAGVPYQDFVIDKLVFLKSCLHNRLFRLMRDPCIRRVDPQSLRLHVSTPEYYPDSSKIPEICLPVGVPSCDPMFYARCPPIDSLDHFHHGPAKLAVLRSRHVSCSTSQLYWKEAEIFSMSVVPSEDL